MMLEKSPRDTTSSCIPLIALSVQVGVGRKLDHIQRSYQKEDLIRLHASTREESIVSVVQCDRQTPIPPHVRLRRRLRVSAKNNAVCPSLHPRLASEACDPHNQCFEPTSQREVRLESSAPQAIMVSPNLPRYLRPERPAAVDHGCGVRGVLQTLPETKQVWLSKPYKQTPEGGADWCSLEY